VGWACASPTANHKSNRGKFVKCCDGTSNNCTGLTCTLQGMLTQQDLEFAAESSCLHVSDVETLEMTKHHNYNGDTGITRGAGDDQSNLNLISKVSSSTAQRPRYCTD